MKPPGRRVAAALSVAALVAACASSGGSNGPSPSDPSGSLGPVTAEAADVAVRGLCEIRREHSADIDAANATFYDLVHEELHVIAAATEMADRAAAGELLVTKERVESDLAATELPDTFGGDVDRLVDATLTALRAIDIDVPGCGP